jgi:hypothetical protein
MQYCLLSFGMWHGILCYTDAVSQYLVGASCLPFTSPLLDHSLTFCRDQTLHPMTKLHYCSFPNPCNICKLVACAHQKFNDFKNKTHFTSVTNSLYKYKVASLCKGMHSVMKAWTSSSLFIQHCTVVLHHACSIQHCSARMEREYDPYISL